MKGLFAALILALVLCNAAHAEAPRVVTSIKPLHALAAAVMEGVAMPQVLIKGGGSVHAYALRMSDAAILSNAQVVFWIGPTFENFLVRPLNALGQNARIVALMDAPGITVRPARSGGLWDADQDKHDDGRKDGHIWLDPGNAKAIAFTMVEVLSAADPANAARYGRNALAVQAKLDALDAELLAKLAPVAAKPFVVFHDAYQYLEAHYGLHAVGSITMSADRAAGAQRINQIKQQVGATDDLCIFAEPQFEPKLIGTLIEGTDAKTGVLDPEASTLPAGAGLYADLMRGLADNLVSCLAVP
jgi:zinc transport system substrate-binding protein